jgi:hypothetical protein
MKITHFKAAQSLMPASAARRIALALAAVVVVSLLAAGALGGSVQICQVDQAGEQTNCSSYNLALYIILRAGEIINYYSPFATAVAAIAIAGLTLSLRQAQERMLASAGAQVAADKQRYKVLDRAYVAVEAHGVSLVPVPDSPGKMRTVAGVAIENSGHTPALLKELYGEFRDSSPVGEAPSYAGGQTWALNFQVGGRKPQTFLDKEFPFYSSKTTHHYFLGYVTYVDVYGETHTARFCAMIMPHREKWNHAGPSGWNAWD